MTSNRPGGGGPLKRLVDFVIDAGRFVVTLDERLKLVYLRLSSDSHAEFYRQHMRAEVERDPREAVGGFNEVGEYETMGELQMEWLKAEGMVPSDSLLDVGCGTLRAGRYFIAYLDPGHYWGMDVSADAIEAGKVMLGEGVIEQKRPTFHVNDDLTFRALPEEEFEYAIANSVFSHIPKSDIEECLCNVGRVLSADGRFYATFKDASTDDSRIASKLLPTTYYYTADELAALAEECDVAFQVRDEYPHPNQRLIEIRRDD